MVKGPFAFANMLLNGGTQIQVQLAAVYNMIGLMSNTFNNVVFLTHRTLAGQSRLHSTDGLQITSVHLSIKASCRPLETSRR